MSGCSSTNQTNNQINNNNTNNDNEKPNEIPSSFFIANPLQGYSPLIVNFTYLGNDSDGFISKYAWDFNDGNFSIEKNPIHVFKTAGNYTVSLVVTDNENASSSHSVMITVTIKNEPPTVRALADKTNGLGPLTVHFQCIASDPDGNITKYNWNFDFYSGGIPQTSSEKNPVVTFLNGGVFHVVLVVTDNRGSTAQSQINITVEDYRMALLDVTNYPYLNEIRIHVRIEAGTNNFMIHANFQAESENGLIYKTTWFEAGYPDIITAGNSADIGIIFKNIPEDITLVELVYTAIYPNWEASIPPY